MTITSVVARLQDPYERKARIFPALLVALPITVPLICTYGPKHPVLTSILALFGGCGVIFAIANIARGLGKKQEDILVKRWGGLPTTIALRHNNYFFDSITKARYHNLISIKLGIVMPSAMDEERDSLAADDCYSGASKRLREMTRDTKKFSLLFKDNIAYGFHRNMLGVRLIGVAASFSGIFYALIDSGIIQILGDSYFHMGFLTSLEISHGLTLGVSLVMLIAWVFYFNEASVKRIGFSYAERLFEALPSLNSPRVKTKTL